MSRFWCTAAVAAVALGVGSASMAAQTASPSCPSGAPGSAAQITQDACQQTVDLFQFMAPQLGAAIAGGNATLGQAGALGGLGHFSFGLRANVVEGSFPQVDQFQTDTNGASRKMLPTKDNQPLPMPVASVAIGLYRGFPVGVTNVGGVDLLLNVAYIPEVDQADFTVTEPNGSWKVGYGARVGIVQESIFLPGVGVTYLKRDLPVVTLQGSPTDGGSLSVQNLTISTSAYRFVASKHFLIFGLAAGFGQDKYDQSALVQATATSNGFTFTSQQIGLTQSLTRNTVFGDLTINLFIMKLVGEVGQVSGGNIQTYNTFSGKGVNASRTYGSVGLRFDF